LNNNLPTNAKIHFGYVTRTGGVRYLVPTKSSDFVYFDGSEYFVIFTRMKRITNLTQNDY
jgi:hypothetical protein